VFLQLHSGLLSDRTELCHPINTVIFMVFSSCVSLFYIAFLATSVHRDSNKQ